MQTPLERHSPRHDAVPRSPSGLTPRIERNSLSITFAFECNLACSFCMVEAGMGVWEGVSLERFAEFARDGSQTEGLERIILSGGEVTLDKRLPEYVRIARSIPGVQHVRIQTNGIRLGKGDYLQQLVDVGVDEFFVSIHGHDAASCDTITRKRGSFDAILAGIAKVGAHPGATLITDTAVCRHNVEHLAEVVRVVAPHRPESMEFWSLWPQIDKDDERGLFVRVTEAAPRIIEALDACLAADILPVVRNFPRCLLRGYTQYHYDLLPPTFIDAGYWQDAPEYDCIFRGVCSSGTRSAPGIIEQRREPLPEKAQAHDCLGLSAPYVKKYGWEEQALQPFLVPGATGYRQTASSDLRQLFANRLPLADGDSSRPSDSGRSPLDALLEHLGIGAGLHLGPLRVARIDRESHRVTLVVASDADSVRIWLYPAAPDRTPFARVGGVDIVYERDAERLGPPLEQALDALVERLAADAEQG